MKKAALVTCLAMAGLLLVCRANAAESPKFNVIRTPDLIGKPVVNGAGTVLGKFEDYVINIKDGKVVYGVVHYGETLGFGGKQFAVPPQALIPSADLKTIVFEVSKEELEQAPGFDANKWPAEPDPRWAKKGTAGGAVTAPVQPRKDEDRKEESKKDEPRKDEVKKDDTKKDETRKEEDKTVHLRRITSLMGTPVRNHKGDDLGTVQGFALHMKEHKVSYAAMAFGGVLGVGTKYFAIPWEALSLQSPTLKAGDKVFVVEATKDELERQPGFDGKVWPQEPDEHFKKGAKKEPTKP